MVLYRILRNLFYYLTESIVLCVINLNWWPLQSKGLKAVHVALHMWNYNETVLYNSFNAIRPAAYIHYTCIQDFVLWEMFYAHAVRSDKIITSKIRQVFGVRAWVQMLTMTFIAAYSWEAKIYSVNDSTTSQSQMFVSLAGGWDLACDQNGGKLQSQTVSQHNIKQTFSFHFHMKPNIVSKECFINYVYIASKCMIKPQCWYLSNKVFKFIYV